MADEPNAADAEYPPAGMIAMHYVASAVCDLAMICNKVRDPSRRKTLHDTTSCRINWDKLPEMPRWRDLFPGCFLEVEVCGISKNEPSAEMNPLEGYILPPFELYEETVGEGAGIRNMKARVCFGGNGLEAKYSEVMGRPPVELREIVERAVERGMVELPNDPYRVRVWLRINRHVEPADKWGFFMEYGKRLDEIAAARARPSARSSTRKSTRRLNFDGKWVDKK
jgi:hypothetical protein